MGILTSLVSAPSSDATSIGSERTWRDQFTHFDLPRIDLVALAELLAILRADGSRGINQIAKFTEVYSVPEGPWVLQFPHEFVQLINDKTTDELQHSAVSWSEIVVFGISTHDIHKLLLQIQAFCAESAGKQQPVLLWICL
jgi:hypothetical protein